MSSKKLRAIFEAREEISSAIARARQSTQAFDRKLNELSVTMAEIGMNTKNSNRMVSDLADGMNQVSTSSNALDQSLQEVSNSFMRLIHGSSMSEEEVQEFGNAVTTASQQTSYLDSRVDMLKDALVKLALNTAVAPETLARLNREVKSLSATVPIADNHIEELTQSMMFLYAATKTADSGVSSLSRDINSLSGDLALLNAIAGTTAFRFSSLSVNIGPFNLALENILTQLPAILTGMSTMLAIVSSLITAFATLGLVTGGLILGGAIAFFEEFKGQFEDTSQAVEALTGALRDLFVEALDPLINAENITLFVGFVEGLADIVNRTAQFINQMRGIVLRFVDTLNADMDSAFNAIRDSFVEMQPILRGVIEFFLNEVPLIIEEFSMLTAEISDDINTIINSLGGLISQLLQFAKVIISVLAPALQIIVGSLTLLFAELNALPNFISSTVIGLGALVLVFSVISVKIARLVHGFKNLSERLNENAGSASVLGSAYMTLSEELSKIMAGQQTLAGALKETWISLKMNTTSWSMNTVAKLKNVAASNIFVAAASRQLGIIGALTAGNIALSDSILLTYSNMKLLISSTLSSTASMISYAATTGAASAAQMALNGAIQIFHTLTGNLTLLLAVLISSLVALAGITGSTENEIGGLNGALSGLSGVINVLVDGLLFLADVVLAFLIPPLNLLLSVFQMFGSIAGPIVDVFIDIAEALNLTSSSAEGSTDTLGSLATVIIDLVSWAMVLFDVLALLVKAFGQAMATGIRLYFELISRSISRAVTLINQFINTSKSMDIVQSVFEGVQKSIDQAFGLLEDFIDLINEIPGIDIEGPTIDARNAREELTGGEQDKDQIETEANVDLSFEESVEQNVDVQADPEDKAQLSRITKDAIAEANRFARRQQGGQ
jgi:DNA-binding NarL/FixJ family response regulator